MINDIPKNTIYIPQRNSFTLACPLYVERGGKYIQLPTTNIRATVEHDGYKYTPRFDTRGNLVQIYFGANLSVGTYNVTISQTAGDSGKYTTLKCAAFVIVEFDYQANWLKYVEGSALLAPDSIFVKGYTAPKEQTGNFVADFAYWQKGFARKHASVLVSNIGRNFGKYNYNDGLNDFPVEIGRLESVSDNALKGVIDFRGVNEIGEVSIHVTEEPTKVYPSSMTWDYNKGAKELHIHGWTSNVGTPIVLFFSKEFEQHTAIVTTSLSNLKTFQETNLDNGFGILTCGDNYDWHITTIQQEEYRVKYHKTIYSVEGGRIVRGTYRKFNTPLFSIQNGKLEQPNGGMLPMCVYRRTQNSCFKGGYKKRGQSMFRWFQCNGEEFLQYVENYLYDEIENAHLFRRVRRKWLAARKDKNSASNLFFRVAFSECYTSKNRGNKFGEDTPYGQRSNTVILRAYFTAHWGFYYEFERIAPPFKIPY